MRPIRKELLVNTITVFNYYKDENGDKSYILSVIKQCVAYNKTNVFAAQSYGISKQNTWNILIDSRNSYCDGKKYLDFTEWKKLSDYDKENFWTLQEQDVIVKGAFDPEESVDFDTDDIEHFVIKEIKPYQDKDGSIHSREVICV